jgi:hypothetical protein
MGRLILLTGPSCAGKSPLYAAFCKLPNHDGEDSENWDAFYYPLGEARKALLAFVDLVAGRVPSLAEKWDEELLS